MLQPVLVRRDRPDGYQLVAGERRLRAAQLAGLEQIPAIVREVDDREMMELALIENIQREDLNPIDEAKAYQALVEQGRAHARPALRARRQAAQSRSPIRSGCWRFRPRCRTWFHVEH